MGSEEGEARLCRLCARMHGCSSFVHPSSMTKTRRLDPADVRKPKSGELSKPWHPSDTSTQVELVELLQFVLLLRDSIGRLPVAGIISAWDLIRGAVPPAEWFADRLPLLSQFLQANSEDVPFQVYGISAQGGDLEKDRGSYGLRSIRQIAFVCSTIRGVRTRPVFATSVCPVE